MIKQPIFFVTPDPSKAIGLEKILTDYHIVCYEDSDMVDILSRKGVKIFCLKKQTQIKDDNFLRNAGKLLEQPKVQEYIEKESKGVQPAILYFKPSPKIDLLCQQWGYLKLGNSAALNKLYEDKVSFYSLALERGWPVPPGTVEKTNRLDYVKLSKQFGSKLVVQLGRGWAGTTTYFIEEPAGWEELTQQLGNRVVKVTGKIDGRTYLNNACVAGERILVSKPAIQLASPFAGSNLASTYGRQWPSVGLNAQQEQTMKEITENVGREMASKGYGGWFGLDFLVNQTDGKVFISENNARLTASVSFFTQMEMNEGVKHPLLLWHICSFVDPVPNTPTEWQEKDFSAAQLVLRNEHPNAAVISHLLKCGVYKTDSNSLQFIRETVDSGQLDTKEEFLIFVNPSGSLVKSGYDYLTLQIKERLLSDNLQYHKKWLDVIELLARSVKLEQI